MLEEHLSDLSTPCPPPDADTMSVTASRQATQAFHDNVSSFWCDSAISVLSEPPSPLVFLRDFVSRSRPCIIRHAFVDATTGETLSLTLNQLVHDHPNLELRVDVTPDGHGDCIRKVRSNSSDQEERVFVEPLQQTMTTTEFRRRLRQHQNQTVMDNGLVITDSNNDCRPADRVFDAVPPIESAGPIDETASSLANDTPSGVVYYSRQNDCLRSELAPLAARMPSTVPFAQDALGTGPPDAINLWMGNECSVSSLHKDPYENFMYVLSGTKVFWLCPPADAIYLKQRDYPTGSFVCSRRGDWKVQRNEDATNRVRWIGMDPTLPPGNGHDDDTRLPCHVMEVHVQAGEMLYLPSLWFHKVTQTCETVAINYWYDMAFDAKWCYFELMEALEPGARYAVDESRNVEGGD